MACVGVSASTDATVVSPTVSAAGANVLPPVSHASTGAGHDAVSAAEIDAHVSDEGTDEEQNDEDGQETGSSGRGKKAETKEKVTKSNPAKTPEKTATEKLKGNVVKQTSLSFESIPAAETKAPAKASAVAAAVKPAPSAASEKVKTRGEKNARAATTQ